jgi:hypothetical protein
MHTDSSLCPHVLLLQNHLPIHVLGLKVANIYVLIFFCVLQRPAVLQTEGRGFDSRWWHWNFSLTSLRSHSGPGVDSASNKNEYQECFLGVKAAGAYGWQPCHLHVPTVLKSGSLNLLEPPGALQAWDCFTFYYNGQSIVKVMAVFDKEHQLSS